MKSKIILSSLALLLFAFPFSIFMTLSNVSCCPVLIPIIVLITKLHQLQKKIIIKTLQ